MPGSAGFDPLGWTADEEDFASGCLFDRVITERGPQLAQPEPAGMAGNIWLIDHGAALYFHQTGPAATRPSPTTLSKSSGPRHRIEQAHREAGPACARSR